MVRRNQTVEDTSPLILYTPPDQWIDGAVADPALPEYSASTFRLTTNRGANASLSFNGTGAWIFGAKRGNHGPYAGFIDGQQSPQQNGSASPDQFQVLLYSATNLTMGHHTVSIQNQDVDSVNAPYLDVDFIVFETEIPDSATQPTYQLDDADPSFLYQPPGQWSTNQCDNIGGYASTTCHVTSSATASVQFTFNGNAVAIYGGVGPKYGPYTVSIDKGGNATFTANSTSHHTGQMLYFASNLGGGNHTVTMSNNPSSPGQILDIDYIQIIGGGSPSEGGTRGQKNRGGEQKSNAGVIAGGIVAGVVVLALVIFGLVFWRRRRRRALSSPVDIDDVHDPNTDSTMRMVPPTPYKPEENGSGSHIQPITGYTTEYALSERLVTPTQGHSSLQGDSFRHQARPSVTNLTSYSGDGTTTGSRSGASVGGVGSHHPPISAVGAPTGKGQHTLSGPTVRNDHGQTSPSPMLDPPPSYS